MNRRTAPTLQLEPRHRQKFWWLAATQNANRRNFRATFGVKQDEVNAAPLSGAPVNPSRVRDIRCAAPQGPAWEYRIGIAPANTSADQKDVQELFFNVLGKRGWIFVSENRGIFHFKRPKL